MSQQTIQSIPLSETDFLQEVQRIKERYPATTPIGRTNPEQLERLSGIFANDSFFEAAVHAGEAWRSADRLADETDEEPNIAQRTIGKPEKSNA